MIKCFYYINRQSFYRVIINIFKIIKNIHWGFIMLSFLSQQSIYNSIFKYVLLLTYVLETLLVI